ncbi:magnesium transporter [Malaciobacter halophilus]|uniref:Magnesium transporter n=1 Tax=Malaciobacter halophilus TaxID=197482 RepID=A0A2N1J238_9BACT|nr:CorA family divalent cation transporter [Malaciobacter halophilus]AXH10580.1 magnesium and cobalt transport protein [Malaciobacter halophilus]PKI80623.1 magnesium transporter [Malaciobacter halophilus]
MLIKQIDSLHQEDLKNPLHPSIFYSDENYDLFILRLPFVLNDKLEFINYSFIITDEIYYLFDKQTNQIVALDNIKQFYLYLDKAIKVAMKLTNDYYTKTLDLEESIYENKSQDNFNKTWYEYKNELIRVNRVLYKANEALENLIDNYKTEKDYLERNFADIQEHLQRSYRNSGLCLEKLDTLYNFYQSKTSEQMNRIVYILTLLSAIFLPLNLIVGFFGMNTTALPFTKIENGTFFVITILLITLSISTLLAFYIKRK